MNASITSASFAQEAGLRDRDYIGKRVKFSTFRSGHMPTVREGTVTELGKYPGLVIITVAPGNLAARNISEIEIVDGRV